LLIQVSLLLVGIALGASIWMQQPAIATPVVLMMAFGALFYGAFVGSICTCSLNLKLGSVDLELKLETKGKDPLSVSKIGEENR
jgi:hypothetical protein